MYICCSMYITAYMYTRRYTADLKSGPAQTSTNPTTLPTSQHPSDTIDSNITSSTTTQPSSQQHISTTALYKSAAISAAGDDNFNDFGYWRKPIPTINI